MSKQENGLSRRQMSGMTVGHTLRRSALAGIAAMLMGASLTFTGGASAHNIDLAKAQEIARDYARSVRKESNGKYPHYSTDCYKLFQGHNHYVRCLIEYTNDENPGGTKSALCRETIDVFFQPHNIGERYNYWIKHHSGQCGSRRFRGAMWRLRAE